MSISERWNLTATRGALDAGRSTEKKARGFILSEPNRASGSGFLRGHDRIVRALFELGVYGVDVRFSIDVEFSHSWLVDPRLDPSRPLGSPPCTGRNSSVRPATRCVLTNGLRIAARSGIRTKLSGVIWGMALRLWDH
jgi:hypothetical protein